MSFSRDALIFGLAYLNGPRAILSFGGSGAEMAITPRARAALDELLAAGYAEPSGLLCSTRGREHYRGTAATPGLGRLAQAAGVWPLSREDAWATFAPRMEPNS